MQREERHLVTKKGRCERRERWAKSCRRSEQQASKHAESHNTFCFLFTPLFFLFFPSLSLHLSLFNMQIRKKHATIDCSLGSRRALRQHSSCSAGYGCRGSCDRSRRASTTSCTSAQQSLEVLVVFAKAVQLFRDGRTTRSLHSERTSMTSPGRQARRRTRSVRRGSESEEGEKERIKRSTQQRGNQPLFR